MDAILFARKDAARVLGVCVRTIDNLIASKELCARRIGARVLIHKDELARFAAAGQRRARGKGAGEGEANQ